MYKRQFVRKSITQLPSKMRFVAAQFEALLTDGLWLRAAAHANTMAGLLAEHLSGRPGVQVARSPEVNSVFLRLPSAAASQSHTNDHARRWLTTFRKPVRREPAGCGG